MRAGFKIVMKLGVIGGFLFCTPFFDGMRAADRGEQLPQSAGGAPGSERG